MTTFHRMFRYILRSTTFPRSHPMFPAFCVPFLYFGFSIGTKQGYFWGLTGVSNKFFSTKILKDFPNIFEWLIIYRTAIQQKITEEHLLPSMIFICSSLISLFIPSQMLWSKSDNIVRTFKVHTKRQQQRI